jgi:quercetin dioxygenase-like cupin family protein
MMDMKETFTSSTTGEWRPSKVAAGVSIKMLRNDKDSGESASLVRLEPGASVPAHDHPAGEEVFVLEGDVRIGRHHLKTGDYLYTPPDAKHAAASEGGCVFLVTLPKPVVILKDA